ncbi:hypothetical protein CFC21_085693, partial [Triticum aestivum]
RNKRYYQRPLWIILPVLVRLLR